MTVLKKRKVPLFLLPASLAVVIVGVNFQSSLALTMTNNSNSSNIGGGGSLSSNNLVNDTTTSPLPPPSKSLFSSLFQDHQGFSILKKSHPFPLRESYIAYEQAYPSSELLDPDQYFKPSKFPPNFDNYMRLQNSYPTPHPPPSATPHYPYQYPYQSHHPPPPQPPFLRLVKLPGELKVTVDVGGRNDLEVVCEFPEYLLIVQQIYWHVIPPQNSLLSPYGTFYDSRNGFAPRVTVTSVSKWKSVLRVRDYSPDDFGTYRCVSTSILPDSPDSYGPPPPPPPPPPSPPIYNPHPHSYNLLQYPQESFELRSAAANHFAIPQGSKRTTEGSSRRLHFGRTKREAGAFGVYAPFFRPQYGIYRVYKEVWFHGESFHGAGSEVVENTITPPEDTKNTKTPAQTGESSSNNNKREGRQQFDYFVRRSKVLF